MKKKILISSACLLSFAATAVFANGVIPQPCPIESFVPGVIIGIQGGLVDTGWDSIDNLDIATDASGTASSFIPISSSRSVNVSHDTGFGGRVYLGYDAYSWLGFELGYLDLFQKTKIETPSHTIYDRTKQSSQAPYYNITQNNADISTQAIDLVGKLKSPVYHGLNLYAKAGVAYMMSHGRTFGYSIDFTTQSPAAKESQGYNQQFLDDSVDKFGPVYGVGISYALPAMQNLSLDLSWTRYDSGHEKIDNDYLPNLDFYALGIAYKFNV